jgi:hypothetical protein
MLHPQQPAEARGNEAAGGARSVWEGVVLMKLCDRCFQRGESRQGVIQVTIGDEHPDLCVSCADEIRGMIFDPPKQEKQEKKSKR